MQSKEFHKYNEIDRIYLIKKNIKNYKKYTLLEVFKNQQWN